MTAQERLRKYAKDNSLTHEALAERLGLERETVTRVINGQQPLTERIVGKFVIAFGVDAYTEVFSDGDGQSGQRAEVEATA